MSFEESKKLFEEVIRKINKLLNEDEIYKIAKQTAKEIIRDLVEYKKLYKKEVDDGPLFNLMLKCYENLDNTGMLYKTNNLTNKVFDILCLSFKKSNNSNPAATRYIKTNETESLILEINILSDYPTIMIRDINEIVNNSDLIAHELTHMCNIIINKILPSDQVLPKTQDEYEIYHNLEDEFFPWVAQLAFYIEDSVEKGKMTAEQLQNLIKKDSSSKFFDYCFDILPQKNFLIHINYLTSENKERYYKSVKNLLERNMTFEESHEYQLDFETRKKNLANILKHNLHLAIPESDIDFSRLVPMKNIIPESCIGMTKDEFKAWLKINRPEYYKKWYEDNI